MQTIDVQWRKSTYSSGNGGQCVEVVTAPWRKSTHSGNGGMNCVEAAHSPGAILIRDTKNQGQGPVLAIPPAAWQSFTRTLRTKR